jgi:hypothetical protein
MESYEPDHEALKSKETTTEGKHLHEPDAFPHAMMGRLVLLAVVFAIAVGGIWAASGTGGALFGGFILLVIVFPLVASRVNRRVQRERDEEIEDEHRAEAREQAGVPAAAVLTDDDHEKRRYPSHQW